MRRTIVIRAGGGEQCRRSSAVLAESGPTSFGQAAKKNRGSEPGSPPRFYCRYANSGETPYFGICCNAVYEGRGLKSRFRTLHGTFSSVLGNQGSVLKLRFQTHITPIQG